MPNVIIGKVADIEGVFLSKSLDGKVRELHSGDPVYAYDFVYPKTHNPSFSISIDLLNSKTPLVLNGESEALFDSAAAGNIESFDSGIAPAAAAALAASSTDDGKEKEGDIDETAAGHTLLSSSDISMPMDVAKMKIESVDVNAHLIDFAYGHERNVRTEDPIPDEQIRHENMHSNDSFPADTEASAGISVDPITADDTINAAESATTVRVSGSVSGDAAAGDTVTMTINGTEYTAEVDSDGNWSVDVAGSDLAADTSFEATVTGSDDAGNPFSASTVSEHSVDLSADADENLTIAVAADDKVADAEESDDVSSVIGGVDSDASSVTVTYTDQNGLSVSVDAVKDASGNWVVPDADISGLADGNVTVVLSVTDAAGNVATASDSMVKDTEASAGISVDPITADDTINAAESATTVRVSGSVSGDAAAGDTVTMTINGTEYTAEVDSDGNWSVDVAGSDLAADTSFEATVTGSDDAGNPFSASTVSEHSVDLSADADENLTIAVAADDKVADAEESDDVSSVIGGVDSDASSVTVTYTDQNGLSVSVDAVKDASGNWVVPDADISGLADGNVTVVLSVTDAAGNVATASDSMVKDTEASALDGSIQLQEDTPYIFQPDDFKIDQSAGDTLDAVRIGSLPANGVIEFYDGTQWSAVSVGQEISASDLSGGALRFVPDQNESGADIYGGSGIGDQQADYASFEYFVYDGINWSSDTGTMSVDVLPVADAPEIQLHYPSEGEVGSFVSVPDGNGLIKTVYENIGRGPKDSSELENLADNTQGGASSLETQPYRSGGNGPDNIEEGTLEVTEGLIYLEAGTEISFSGYYDDSFRLELGGQTIIETTGDTWGTYDTSVEGTFRNGGGYMISSGTFTAETSGYYTFEMYIYNGDGPGDLSVNVSVDGADPVPFNTDNFELYTSISEVDGAGGQHSLFDPAPGSDGGVYEVNVGEGVEGSPIRLPSISTSLSDTDGSESITGITMSSIPDGATISDGVHSFTATAGSDEADLSGWNLENLTITASADPAEGPAENFSLTVTVTSSETADGTIVDSSQSSVEIPVTVYDSQSDVMAYEGLDVVKDGGDGYDILTLSDSIDFSTIDSLNDPIKNMEEIQMNGNGEQSISNLTVDDVLDMTDDDNTLVIKGDSEDSVTLADTSGFDLTGTETIDGKLFNIYSDSATDPTVVLKIEQDIDHN